MAQVCGCGEIARCRTSWTAANPCRRFLGCPNYMDPARNCNFFQWVDAELPNQWYRRRFVELNEERRNQAQEIGSLQRHKSRLVMYVWVLIVVVMFLCSCLV